jgi:hypothetical protein
VRNHGAVLSFGDQNSRNFNISGDRRGCWYDFRRRVGGRGILGLVANELFSDTRRTRDAYAHATDWLRTVDPTKLPAFETAAAAAGDDGRPPTDVPLLTLEKIATLTASQVAVDSSTLFADYFCKTRGLGALPSRLVEQWRSTMAVVGLPHTKYWIAKDDLHACMAVFVRLTNQDGQLAKIQQTYLTPTSPPSKLRLVRGDIQLAPKKTRNVLADASNAFLCVYESPLVDAPILLSEGLETACSISLAFPLAHVFVSCGVGGWRQFDRRVALPAARTVILCRDNDTGRGATATADAAARAASALHERGYAVHQIRPLPAYGDFNDVHRALPGAAGTAAIVNMVRDQLPPLMPYADDDDAALLDIDLDQYGDDDDALMAIDIPTAAMQKRPIPDDDDDIAAFL